MTTHTTKRSSVPICQLLPEQARRELVSAGIAKDMAAINAAHRYARAMHPKLFNMDDLSYSVQTPRASD